MCPYVFLSVSVCVFGGGNPELAKRFPERLALFVPTALPEVSGQFLFGSAHISTNFSSSTSSLRPASV